MQRQDKNIKKRARSFMDAAIHELENEASSGRFPLDKWEAIARTGIFERAVSSDIDKRESVLSTLYGLERLGEICKDSGLSFSVATHLASTITALNKFGSQELKHEFMESLVKGRLIGAHAISEPQAGSDALSMTTTAREEGDDYVLNGHKAFVTNGNIADVIVVYAKTSDSSTADCVSAFLVDTKTQGVRLGKEMEKVGLHTSPLCELTLEECRVPKANMIGRRGAGFFVLSHVMQREILFAFMLNVGEMKRRLDRCVSYVNSRHQFDSPIGSFQSVSNRIADMKIRYELSRQWLYHVAEKMIDNKDITSEVAIAKVFVSENALATSVDALHIHGGYGYVASNGFGEEVCNALSGPIYSGTNDIQRGRIAAMLGVATQSKKRSESNQIRVPNAKKAPKVVEHSESETVFDYQHPDVQSFVQKALGSEKLNKREAAVKLYYAVRDKIAYMVFNTDISEKGLRASSIVKAGIGFCLHKAILYAATCHSQGIECRIVANRVNNHISTPELQDLVGGEVFLHWYNEVKIDGKWLKVSPVFNSLLCKLYGLETLEFDGFSDALAQPYSDGGTMNYIGEPIRFEQPNYQQLIDLVDAHHPNMVTESGTVPQARKPKSSNENRSIL